MQWADDGFYEINEQVVQGLTTGIARMTDPASSWTDKAKALGDRYRKRDPEITETEAGRRGFKAVFQLAG
ncbi:unnamed protein product, partial [marine sediment metagenome]